MSQELKRLIKLGDLVLIPDGHLNNHPAERVISNHHTEIGLCTIIKFGETSHGRLHKNPGVYEDPTIALFRSQYGDEFWWSTRYIKLRDPINRGLEYHPENNLSRLGKFIRPLPETDFMEKDTVFIGGHNMHITHVNYLNAHKKDYPAYSCGYFNPHALTISCHSKSDIRLVERGEIWEKCALDNTSQA